MPVILREVAAVAGVSVSTASRALRGDPRISGATAQKVRAAAQQLGYQPDPLLGALARYRERARITERSQTIVYVSTWPSKGGRVIMTDGLVERAAGLGYRLELLTLGPDAAEQRAAGQRLVARGVRGLLLGTGHVQQDELDLPWEHFACVSVSGAPTMRGFPSVTANYVQNLRVVLTELQRRGYRRPGLVLDPWTLWATREASVAGWGHAFGVSRTRPATPLRLTEADDPQQLGRWVRRERLDAVIAFSGHVRRLLVEADCAVPDQLGFAALDAQPRSGVAGIIQPRAACQRVALDLLVARLHQHEYGPLAEPYSVQLAGTWMDGPTVRALKS
jgi:LacI family transcriptional regulator